MAQKGNNSTSKLLVLNFTVFFCYRAVANGLKNFELFDPKAVAVPHKHIEGFPQFRYMKSKAHPQLINHTCPYLPRQLLCCNCATEGISGLHCEFLSSLTTHMRGGIILHTARQLAKLYLYVHLPTTHLNGTWLKKAKVIRMILLYY